jgi:hypothetical protein
MIRVTSMRIPWILLILAVFAGALSAQQKPPELTGTLTFHVGSGSGRVETLAVQVGDGGTGRYKAILAGDSSLPTHAIYRPRDLRPFGGKRLLPVVAFGNGGCRNTSGEFRNFLSEIASHGYIVIAIGPAGDALVGGSEARMSQTQPVQLLDGIDWITKENDRQGSEYYKKIDPSKVAVMGQSCGTGQATQVSGDPRVTTTVLLNGGGPMGMGGARGNAAPTAPNPAGAQGANAAPPAGTAAAAGRGGAPQAAGTYGNTNTAGIGNMMAALSNLSKRYAPYAPPDPPFSMGGRGTTGTGTAAAPAQPAAPVKFHGPVAYIPGGPSDMAFNGAVAGFEAQQDVPALLAYQDVGHYPATYREPHGGAYAIAVTAWLDWQLKGDLAASRMIIGTPCGLCKNPKWTVKIKNLPK